MPKRQPNQLDKAPFATKKTLISSFLVANAFVWYVSAFSYLQYLAEAKGSGLLTIVTINLTTLVLTAFIATLLRQKLQDRLTFLKYWIAAGVLLSVSFVFLEIADFSTLLVMAALVGVYFGFGMPTCIAYFAKETDPQIRAKASGIIILFLGVGYTAITIVADSALILAGILTVWRITSLLPILKAKKPQDPPQVESKEKVTYRSIFSNRAFLLYTIPWLMFSLINDLTMDLNMIYFNNTFPAAFGENYNLIVNVILADKNGRKRLALVAFAMLGVSYASLGLFSGQYFAALFYVCVDGFAWGAFSMLFLFTVWGDIAQKKNAEKFYFLGVLPYLFSNFIRIAFGQVIAGYIGNETMVFSFASFFLFVAILPLAYAPETLSEKIIKKVELDGYIEKALQEVQKQKTE
jgi:MFS family permease